MQRISDVKETGKESSLQLLHHSLSEMAVYTIIGIIVYTADMQELVIDNMKLIVWY